MTSAYSTTFYNLVAPFYNLSVGWAYLDGRKMLREYLRSFPAGSLLEIGCGTGSNIAFIPEHFNVTALEPSRGMYKRARRRFPQQHIVNTSLSEFTTDKQYDIILLSHVVSVVRDPGQILGELSKRLAPHGKVIVMNHFGKKPNWLLTSMLKVISLYPNEEPHWDQFGLNVISRKNYGFNKHLSFIVLGK